MGILSRIRSYEADYLILTVAKFHSRYTLGEADSKIGQCITKRSVDLNDEVSQQYLIVTAPDIMFRILQTRIFHKIPTTKDNYSLRSIQKG